MSYVCLSDCRTAMLLLVLWLLSSHPLEGRGFPILQALVSFRKHHLIARVLVFGSEMLLRDRYKSSVAERAVLNRVA